MKRMPAIVSLLLLVILIHPTFAIAQGPVVGGDWTAVQEVAPGQELVVELKDGKSLKGKLNSATADELSIIRKNKSENIQRDRIAQVYRVKGKAEKGKYAAIGAGIGAGVGLGIGLAQNSPPKDDGEIYPIVATPLGAGIGAAVGFLFGQTKRKRVLIYQAK